MKKLLASLLLAALLTAPVAARADAALDDKIASLQKSWAVVKYETRGAEAQTKAIRPLTAQAAALAAAHPREAAPKIVHGIMLATDASFNRGLSSLPKVKQAKALFEEAISIDPKALDAAGYTYLGSLYDQVPGWPVGFGDKDKAADMFAKALKIAPNNIDANYFYGQHLMERGERDSAKAAFEKALRAPDRPGRKLADEGRRAEIRALMAELAAPPKARAANSGVNQ
jgi:tetratricopeptide (TPR) repeat protein